MRESRRGGRGSLCALEEDDGGGEGGEDGEREG